MEQAIKDCHQAFLKWKAKSAEERAEVIKNIGKKLAEHKKELSKLMTSEMGKLLSRENRKLIYVQEFVIILLKTGLKVLRMKSENYQKEVQAISLILHLGSSTEYNPGISHVTRWLGTLLRI